MCLKLQTCGSSLFSMILAWFWINMVCFSMLEIGYSR